MLLTMLKCKLHRATVTECDLNYEGSISIDRKLIDASGLLLNERVEIYNIDNGERFATYAIPGPRGKGEIVINGAAAHKAGAGDVVILATYADYEDADCRAHQPSLVFVDAKNRIVVQSHERVDETLLAAVR